MNKRPIHPRITPPPPIPLVVWCTERARGHHQVVFLLFPLEENLSFIADTNAPNLVLEFLLCTCCPSLKCLPLSSTVKQHTS